MIFLKRREIMATKVLVPLLGEGVEEVTVIKWLKKEGDSVNELEPLLEVNTDKVDTEIPAPASGTILKIMAEEGLPAKVGSVLALIGKRGESVDVSSDQVSSSKLPSVKTSQNEENVTPDTSHMTRDIGFISPVVAKVAAEHGVNLQQINGTGMNGRITKNDVMAFVESGGQKTHSEVETGDNRPQTSPLSHPPLPVVVPMLGDQLIKHTTIRRQIAEHMVMSKHTSPHVLTVMEADMSRVSKHRSANKEIFARDGVKLTFTPYFMMAIVAGLKNYPTANSSWSDEGILVHKAVNIGMATSLGEDGLIVPVIKGADNHSLLAMARAVNDLANRARSKKLQPDDVKGGTFTLTNHGISGVGAMQKRVVVIDDAIAIRPMVYLSFVFDHRILDGASADWFLAKVKETLENWT
jgi:2-oxoglutarate dehydrogenase E2 component (dihydrolipoamide succinyltransferase)